MIDGFVMINLLTHGSKLVAPGSWLIAKKTKLARRDLEPWPEDPMSSLSLLATSHEPRAMCLEP